MDKQNKFNIYTEEEIKKAVNKAFKGKLNSIPLIGEYIKNKRLDKLNQMVIDEVDYSIYQNDDFMKSLIDESIENYKRR